MPIGALTHYRMFGRYNAWANGRLYAAAARLSDEQYRADRGAFFKSIHRTLNHLLATDRIWMQRFCRVSSSEQFEQQLASALAHWFNHQTHHRGQVHAMLTGLVGEAPELDLLFFQRTAAKPAV
jgi:uncharacterized damage-inducible protein DinB